MSVAQSNATGKGKGKSLSIQEKDKSTTKNADSSFKGSELATEVSKPDPTKYLQQVTRKYNLRKKNDDWKKMQLSALGYQNGVKEESKKLEELNKRLDDIKREMRQKRDNPWEQNRLQKLSEKLQDRINVQRSNLERMNGSHLISHSSPFEKLLLEAERLDRKAMEKEREYEMLRRNEVANMVG